MDINSAPQLAQNWNTAAGALEGVLDWLGVPLPRHAVMGITGLAWHTCLAERENVAALPSGPVDLDWSRMAANFGRAGVEWEYLGGAVADDPGLRDRAIDWLSARIGEGRPVVGFDFHLHEFGIVFGRDAAREGFLVNSLLAPDIGPFIALRDWPSAAGRIELLAPAEPAEVDPGEVVAGSLVSALEAFAGKNGPDDGQARGTAALERWADILDGAGEIDRQGNAYMLIVLQAARMDGADYLHDLAAALPEAAEQLSLAERAIRDEAQTLSPLVTLFPFPAGGHGNLASAGLREAAAAALRRAAGHERRAAEAITAALDVSSAER